MPASIESKKSKVDVLVVGAGPAGLMAATWLSHLGLSIRIVDKRGTKVYSGQADGLQTRTMEIFESFGIAQRVLREASCLAGMSSWSSDGHGQLSRVNTKRSSGDWQADSRFASYALHQGRVERFLMDSIADASGAVVERGVLPESLSVDASLAESDTAYPIRVSLRHLTEEESTPKGATTALKDGSTAQNGLFRSNMAADDTADVLRQPLPDNAFTEEVEAKYLVGCDGAHSWVRSQLGLKLEGESTDYVWGVLDVALVTDFPDARFINMIQSPDLGSILWIPRENNLVRIYVQLSKVNEEGVGGAKFDRSHVTPEVIMDAARKIMRPYKILFTEVEWWTVYQIGQRVGNHFSYLDRVFLAGDAVHTHSPKAGQGMNVSMSDSYNLGWKLGAVIHGYSDRSILKTYELERRKIAQDLINFDYRLSRVFSAGTTPKDLLPGSSDTNVSMQQVLSDLYHQNMVFMSGMAIDYQNSLVTAKTPGEYEQGGHKLAQQMIANRTTAPPAATGLQVGKRIGDFRIVQQASDSFHHLHQFLRSNGRWRVILFAGDLRQVSQAARLHKLAEQLNAENSFIRRYTPAAAPIEAVIEVLAIHAGTRVELADFAWPRILRSYAAPPRGWNYEKVFVDDYGTNTYSSYGVDPVAGCAVIVRPDQYVAWLGALDDYAAMDRFFGGFMRVQREQHAGALGLPEDWAGYE